MDLFEYEITIHKADALGRVVYFCSNTGDCDIQEVPPTEPQALVDLMNERGLLGWELVQLVFGNQELLACWKRKLSRSNNGSPNWRDAEVERA